MSLWYGRIMLKEIQLFQPLKIKSLELKNRIWVSPMCQYSSKDGHPTDWHLVHLGSRAAGGAGLILVEATAVSPEGRISPDDSGIWSEDHLAGFRRIADFMKAQGAAAGIQLAHAGRKGSTAAPWHGGKVLKESERGWNTLAPSAIAFDPADPAPKEMSVEEIKKTIRDFSSAAVRCLKAGFQVIELHMAHGYLVHQFLSPISNQRTDLYGGSLENRMRFALELAKAVRVVWPMELPLFARISATDWAEGGQELLTLSNGQSGGDKSWKVPDSVVLCQRLKEIGVDLIDCSSGGTLPKAEIPVTPGYQVPFADAIFMAREFLRDPYWPNRAARHFGIKISRPMQYGRS